MEGSGPASELGSQQPASGEEDREVAEKRRSFTVMSPPPPLPRAVTRTASGVPGAL